MRRDLSKCDERPDDMPMSLVVRSESPAVCRSTRSFVGGSAVARSASMTTKGKFG